MQSERARECVALRRKDPIDAHRRAWQSEVRPLPNQSDDQEHGGISLHSVWFRWPQGGREGARQQSRPQQARSTYARTSPRSKDPTQVGHRDGAFTSNGHLKQSQPGEDVMPVQMPDD